MNANQKVRQAVVMGQLPKIKTLTCVDCGAQAAHYHHHNGYEPEHWLDVVPLCRTCHGIRHRGNKVRNPINNFIRLAATPEDKRLLERLAKRSGNMSQSAMVRRLIREEAIRAGLLVETSEPLQA